MRTGTKSILFGVHQVILHPITVWLAWIWLYHSLPNWRETICIIIHDWGYWGKDKMDDEEGERHPELGARMAHWLFDKPRWVLWERDSQWYVRNTKYQELCLFHSRHYARNAQKKPSRLCWADKMSIQYERWWTYLPRAWASGELSEYRNIASNTGYIKLSATHREWFAWIQNRLLTIGRAMSGDVVPYANSFRIREEAK